MTQRKLLRGILAVALAVPLAATLASADTISTRVPAGPPDPGGTREQRERFPGLVPGQQQPRACGSTPASTPQDPLCGFLPGDLPDDAAPISFPDNFPEEFFYQRANASTTMPNGGKVLADLALEGAFGGGPVLDGDQMVFSRVRIKITNVPAGTTYTVTHPYGVERVTASDKNLIFVTDDVGLTPGRLHRCPEGAALAVPALADRRTRGVPGRPRHRAHDHRQPLPRRSRPAPELPVRGGQRGRRGGPHQPVHRVRQAGDQLRRDGRLGDLRPRLPRLRCGGAVGLRQLRARSVRPGGHRPRRGDRQHHADGPRRAVLRPDPLRSTVPRP